MGDKQSHMVIRLLMVTTGLCFLCLPQRQHYKATQCHSRALYISTESQPLPLSHLSKQHDWAHRYIVLKHPGLFFCIYFHFCIFYISGIRRLAFALKISWVSSAVLSPFQKDGMLGSEIPKHQALASVSALHISGVCSATYRVLPLIAFMLMPFPQTGIKMLLGS